jgi:hypothetical protein
MKVLSIILLASFLMSATPYSPNLDAIREWQSDRASLTRFYDKELDYVCYVATVNSFTNLEVTASAKAEMNCFKIK